MFEKLIPIIEKANKIAIFTHTHQLGNAVRYFCLMTLTLPHSD